MVTYNSGSDTVTLTGTQTSPDTLDAIVSAVNNSSKAQKIGAATYLFSFAVLDSSSGFISFTADCLTILNSVRFLKNGSSGGLILNERSIVRMEGTGFSYADKGILASNGYKFISYQDRAGQNPQFILNISDSRYDYFTADDSPIESPTYSITGLDLILYSGFSSCKVFPASGSFISNLRVLVRGGAAEFQCQSGDYNDIRLENSGISTSADGGYTINLNRPIIDFTSGSSSLFFNFNQSATVNLTDVTFPGYAWNGDFSGPGWYSSDKIVNILFSNTINFLSGITPIVMRTQHLRNDGTAITNTATTLGVVGGVVLLTATRTGDGMGSGDNPPNFSYTWSLKARAFAFQVAGGNDTIFSSMAFTSQYILTVQCQSVSYLTTSSETDAGNISGITFAPSGYNSGTITITNNVSVNQIWTKYRYFISQFANFSSNDTWLFNGVTLDIGAWNLTVSNCILTGNIKTTNSVSITGAAGAITGIYTSNAGISVKIVAPNLLYATRVQIYNLTDSVEIFNELLLNSGGYSKRTIWVADKTIRLRATFTNGVNSYIPIETTGVLSNTGVTFLDTQIADTIYNTNAIAGSGVTEFSADYTNLQIDVNDSDGKSTVQRLYAWIMYNMSSADGIRQFFDAAKAEDLFNYQLNSSKVDLQLKNISSVPLIINGGRLHRSDSNTVIAAGGSIQMDPNSGIAEPNQIADALLNRDLTLGVDTNPRSPRNALRALRNKISVSSDGTTLTVTKEDDSSTAWTAAVTSSPGAAPIVGIDPV